MNKQRQDVSDGGAAVQSGRDTIIQTGGVSPSEVVAIVHTVLEREIDRYTAVARETASERSAKLAEKLIDLFSAKERASAEALRDPDFQHLLVNAQRAYVRNDDVAVTDTLIDLIGLRSKQEKRGRLSLTLNEAVEKTAVLTRNEFAELSLVYLLRYTRVGGVVDIGTFIDFLRKHVVPLLPDISRGASSYQYLEAHSCARMDITSLNVVEGWKDTYGGVLSKGFDAAQFDTRPEGGKQALLDAKLIIPCLNDQSKLQLKATGKDAFSEAAKKAGLIDADVNTLWEWFKSTCWNEQELVSTVSPQLREISQIIDVCKSTPLQNLQLTAVGIAIGYANLCRVSPTFKADLSIWIN